MNSAELTWTELADALRSLPDGLGKDLMAGWKEHERDPLLIVTLIGVYDSGKSSLLKRILVEAGEPVPEWLVVSGRPETFVDNFVDVLGCRFRDTPGLASGKVEHDMLALDAASRSDVIWLLILPQLVTSDAKELADLASGRTFHSIGWPYPEGALRAIVSRIDEAGGDPIDDPAGFITVKAAKKKQLEQWFAAVGIHLPPISLVAPDPQGMVQNRTVDRSSYDAGRGWDGVVELLVELERLRPLRPSLRAAAKERFLLRAAQVSLEALDREITLEAARADEVAKLLERKDLAIQDLKTLTEHARADLLRVVEESLALLFRSSAESPERLAERARDRLNDDLGRWAKLHDEALVQLARRIELDFVANARRPAVEAIFVEPSAPAGKKDKEKGLTEKLGDVAGKLRGIIEVGHQAHTGMTMQEARKRLTDPSFLRKLTGKADDITKVSKRWQVASALVGDVVPFVLEFGKLVYDEHARGKETEARSARREALQAELRVWENKVADVWFEGDASTGTPGWRSNVDLLTNAICDHFAAFVRQKESSEQTVKLLIECAARLRSALAAVTPPG